MDLIEQSRYDALCDVMSRAFKFLKDGWNLKYSVSLAAQDRKGQGLNMFDLTQGEIEARIQAALDYMY